MLKGSLLSLCVYNTLLDFYNINTNSKRRVYWSYNLVTNYDDAHKDQNLQKMK